MKNEMEEKKNNEVALVAPMSIEEFSQKWADFQKFVNSQLKDGKDFGKVPGIAKPFLMLPGAQKILSRYLVRPEYTVTNRVENWDTGLFNFEVKCVLCSMRDDSILGEGIGSCNSYEEKYRYNWVTKKKLGNRRALAQREKTGKYGDYVEYKVQRTDLASIHNTILKMSKKRSVIDASLTLSNASEYFTQDIEDIIDITEEEIPETDEATTPQIRILKRFKIPIPKGCTKAQANTLIKDNMAKSKKKPVRGDGKEALIADQEAPPDEY